MAAIGYIGTGDTMVTVLGSWSFNFLSTAGPLDTVKPRVFNVRAIGELPELPATNPNNRKGRRAKKKGKHLYNLQNNFGKKPWEV